MASGEELTPSAYIGHHLSFLQEPAEASGFWTINVDSVVTGALMGIIGLGFLWWVVKGATSGVPGKRQAFVELLFDFIDEQVRGIYHGDRNRFLAPLALTVFVWVVLMNSMDFLPVDWVGLFTEGVLRFHAWRVVATADVNTTFALALSVWLLMIFHAISAKGLGGWVHELFCAPFGSHPLLWPANLAFNLVEYVSKPLSHSMRLYGNMYAGEIIFLLLWMLAAAHWAGTIFSVILGLGWAIFHVLIVLLQAYIFMMLTVVYISMAQEGH